MSLDDENINILYVLVFGIWAVLAINFLKITYTESLSPESFFYLLTLALTLLLFLLNLNSYGLGKNTLHYEKKKNNIELKQKQLQLFYYPLRQLIDKSENSSENLKNDARDLYKYQYLILHNDKNNGNGITTFFSCLENTTDETISG